MKSSPLTHLIYKTVLAFFLLVLSFYCKAQDKIFVINSGEIISKGSAYHDEGKFKEAIAEYKKVDENDTNYVLALYELGLSARVDSQFVLAKEATSLALKKLPNEYEHDLLLQLGSVYDDEEKFDSAAIYFKKVIERFPNSYFGYHSRGINFYLMKQYDSAYSYFEKTVLMNPYASNSHYFLGVLAQEKGYPIQAMMSYGMYLLLSPGGSRMTKVITAMYQLANVSDQVLENYNQRKEEKYFKEDYSEIETYFKSKIALEKEYKIDTKLNEAIFRQLNLICDKLPSTIQNPNDLWSSFYAPIYKELFNEKLFGPTTYMMVSGVENEGAQKLVKEYKKEIENTRVLATKLLDEIGYHRSTNKANLKNEAGYIFENGKLSGKGKFLNGNRETPDGEWVLYDKFGNITTLLNYKNGKIEGNYKVFYYDGKIDKTGSFETGKVKGEVKGYYFNGIQKSSVTLMDEKKENVYKEYYSNGSVALIENYRAGKREGEAIGYFASGAKNYETAYKNDEIDGMIKAYYKNGSLSSTNLVKKGKGEGEKIEYHLNGTISSKGNMQNGDNEGEFTTYFGDGTIASKVNYKKGTLHGPCTYYHRNGAVRVMVNYDNGDQEGASTTKDDEGRIMLMDEFKKGHLKKITYYNVLTNQIAKENIIDDKQKNTLSIYNATGNLLSDIVTDRDGIYNGEFKDYFINGKLKSIKQYDKGKANGNALFYFEDGSISYDENFKDDKLDGMFKSFYLNGKLEKEGMYEASEQQGYWYFYNNLGFMTKKEYYINGASHGYHYNYFPNGKGIVKNREHWDYNSQLGNIEYDTTGKLIHTQEFKPGVANSFTDHNSIGIKTRTGTLVNDYLQGKATHYYPNNQVHWVAGYKNGLIDSSTIVYYSNGKKMREGNYVNNEKVGTWKNYTRTGELLSIVHFKQGESHGKDTFYTDKNTIDIIIPNNEGVRHGWIEKYGLTDDLIYRYHWIDGLLVGYNYQLPDGSICKEIFIENSAKLFEIKTYFKNGKVASEGAVQNGDYQGKRLLYFPDGKIHYQANYLNGRLNGEEKEYYLNGQLNYSKNYVLAELEGVTKKFNEKGILIEEETYFKGYQHGKTKYYDENGKLLQTNTYYWGEILTIE